MFGKACGHAGQDLAGSRFPSAISLSPIVSLLVGRRSISQIFVSRRSLGGLLFPRSLDPFS